MTLCDDRTAALEAVAKAARNLVDSPDFPRTTKDLLRDHYALVEALAALATAGPDGWRKDRPGWYWVKRHNNKWEPRHWVVSGDIRFWDREVREPEIIPLAIGPRLPPPPAPLDNDPSGVGEP